MIPPLSSQESRETTPPDAAADWAIRRATGLTAGETATLLQWLAVDPCHGARLAEAEKAVALIRRPRETGAAGIIIGELRARQETRRRRRHVVAWSAAGLAVAAALVVAFLPAMRRVQELAGSAPRTTVLARPDRKTLPDGSTIHLNAGAEIRVAFTPGRRTVDLLRGEALFTVVADAARPFVVAASGVEVRAVGTEFSVRHAATRVDVLVTEGRVAVAQDGPRQPSPAGAAQAPALVPETIYVTAGSRVSVPVAELASAPTAPQPVTPAELVEALAWRNRRVEFSGTPLEEALALFNAENRIQIVVDEASVAALRVGGIFWTNDPEAFARLLEMSFSLTAERLEPDRIVLRRKR